MTSPRLVVIVAYEIDFENGPKTAEIEGSIGDIEATVRAIVPEAKRIYVEAESRDASADRGR